MVSQSRSTEPLSSWSFLLQVGSVGAYPGVPQHDEIIQRLEYTASAVTKALIGGSTASDTVHLTVSAEPEKRSFVSELGPVGAIVFDSQGHLAAGSSACPEMNESDAQPYDAISANLYADSRLGVLWYVLLLSLL